MLILPEHFFKKCTGLYHLQNQLKYNTGTLFTSVPVLKNPIRNIIGTLFTGMLSKEVYGY
jgi:hypothetical protein